MFQEMKLHILVILLLVFGNARGHRRTIRDVGNSIEESEQQRQQQRNRFEHDWIKFTKTPPTKVLQTPGSPVEIICEVMGSRVPTIQWVAGYLPLLEIENFDSNTITESGVNAIVRVRSINIIDHMLNEPRTYTCVGHTGTKTVLAYTVVYPQPNVQDLLTITNKHFLGPQKPKIIYSEKLHLDVVGSNIMLPCKVHARPRAEVFWMNGEGKLIEPNQRFKVLPSGDLLILEIKWEDMGAYKCIARNSVGKDTADAFIYPVLKEDN